jgi:hypothetical protein
MRVELGPPCHDRAGLVQVLSGFRTRSTRPLLRSQRDGDEETRIDIDEPSSFLSQFPELKASSVPAELDEKMIRLLQQAAE